MGVETSISEIRLPKTALGNDPNDNRGNPKYLESLKVLDDIDAALLQNPTEDKVALIFARRYKGKLMYSPQHDAWFVWSGSCWEKDETLIVKEFVRQLARQANVEGHVRLGKAAFVTGVETLAKGDRSFTVHGNRLDNNNYLLNTPDGTYDLSRKIEPDLAYSSAIRRNHDPDDRITKITAVSPATTGGEVFMRFLNDISIGDIELQLFLQRALGSMLSGACEDHWIMFWIGSGRNGKNTLGDTIKYILGDYAKKIPTSTLLSSKNESHPTEFANLQGIRLGISSEIPEGSFLNEARIKELTGDASISARFMRQNFFEFPRTHKHLVYGNSRPQLRSIDPAIRSRMIIVPFLASFTGSAEDPMLPEKLKRESGFILNWLIEGHLGWLEAGLKVGSCTAVDSEVEDYFSSQSTPDTWLEECCIDVPDDGRPGRQWLTSSNLYESYRSWKQGRGENPLSQTRWAEFMKRRFRTMKASGVRYIGVELSQVGKGWEG